MAKEVTDIEILLAEDDANLGFVVHDNLKSIGYQVTLCSDGEMALKTFASEKFDLCILDVMMPKKDGFAVAQTIRDVNKEIPIVFLTAKTMQADKVKGFTLGADDYITKPFDFEGSRSQVAKDGISELVNYVDSLIVIPNEKLMGVLGEDVTFIDAFGAANDVLLSAVAGIAEIINSPGLINVDFADVKTVMSEMGMAMIGSGYAEGSDRALISAKAAMACPLLEDVNLNNAKGILVNISASQDFKMKEYFEIMNVVKQYAAEDSNIIVGNVIDDSIASGIRVTMVATGLSDTNNEPQNPVNLTSQYDYVESEISNLSDGKEDEEELNVFSNNSDEAIDQQKNFTDDEYDIPAYLRKIK